MMRPLLLPGGNGDAPPIDGEAERILRLEIAGCNPGIELFLLRHGSWREARARLARADLDLSQAPPIDEEARRFLMAGHRGQLNAEETRRMMLLINAFPCWAEESDRIDQELDCQKRDAVGAGENPASASAD